MFEVNGFKVNANLNESVSRGTMRAQDLIPAFIEVLKYTPDYDDIKIREFRAYCKNLSDNDPRWDSEETAWFLNELLWDALNEYAPEGYYFGSHPGDGSDYGFWAQGSDNNL